MRFAAVVVVLIFVIGCAAKQPEPPLDAAASERWRNTDEAVVNALAENIPSPRVRAGGVTHVVLLWLKTPGDAAAIDNIIRTSRQFTQIPGVVSVKVGRPLPSTRPVVDASFDVGLAMSFADEAALQAYETHPQHVKAVREVLRPLAAKIQVYDIKEADASPASASQNRNRTTRPATKR